MIVWINKLAANSITGLLATRPPEIESLFALFRCKFLARFVCACCRTAQVKCKALGYGTILYDATTDESLQSFRRCMNKTFRWSLAAPLGSGAQ